MAMFRSVFLIYLTFLAFTASQKKIRDIEQVGTLNYPTNLENVSLTWPNGSTLTLNFTEVSLSTKSRIVDCFGLGQTAANFLGWWFTINEHRANVLDVRFFLSSRKQRNRVQVLTGRQFGLEWTDFRIERRTVFIVHGFWSHGNETWIREMEDALLLWDDVNVVVVDWAARGNTFNYYKAVVNTQTVGSEIARFLHHIVNATIDAFSSNEPNVGPLHLIGHSLGAHICGLAAKEFKKRQNSWHVSRITGLDPAQPCFNNVSLDLQLDVTDAPFVDVIHTNGRLIAGWGLGLPDPIGHVDFYPNGGKRQPGCLRVQSSYFDYVPLPKSSIEQAICSHGRSYRYLTESIIVAAASNCTFWAHNWDRTYRHALNIIYDQCTDNNCTEMGIRAENHPQRGTFFALTSRASPFCVTNQEDLFEIRRQLIADFVGEIQD